MPPNTVTVKFTNANAKSVSITVYAASLIDVARCAQDALAARWKTTKLNDRRHKWRGY